MKHVIRIILLSLLLIFQSRADVRVVTTLPELADLTKQIGKDRVTVSSIVRGDQNPHFVEVKPSYMMKLKSADVFLTIGMELEMWAPQIVDGSRNNNLEVVDLSKDIRKLEVPAKVDASLGDVHRFGNPHYWLDPRNVRPITSEIIAALAKVSPGDEEFYTQNAEEYLRMLDAKIKEWEAIMKPFAGDRIVTFHKSWSYFAEWLGLVVADYVEPKPGIPPTPGHTAELIQLVRTGDIRAIVVEPFYDLSAPEQIARATSARVIVLPTSIGGVEQAKDYVSLMDYNVRTLAAALQEPTPRKG
jgi:ABC-type Zn uptake system ZnuABC Zn-binding protein ZnuA